MVDRNDTISLDLFRGRDLSDVQDDKGRRHLLLRQLDRVPIEPLLALSRAPYELAITYASPTKVTCADGRLYWLKSRAQRGLTVELIAGRLLHHLQAGPEARIVEVPPIVFRNDPRMDRFRGPVIGSVDLPDTLSTDQIATFLGGGAFDPRIVEPASRARIVAAQTWLNVEDAQVRVGAIDGRVHSVDHGICLDARLKGRPTNVVVTPIPGVSANLGRDWSVMKAAVDLIEAISAEEILACVAGIPDEPGWQSSFERRFAIANWLLKRQFLVGPVMREWCGVMS